MHAEDRKKSDLDPLDEAEKLEAEGKYEEALQKHVWVLDHILEKQPAYYGVRLSFALAKWVELGEKYPKALTTLIEIRDGKASRLSKGEQNRELFHDVKAINQYLKQRASTADLFKKLDASSPGFAEQVYSLAEEDLVLAGEYQIARKYLKDPKAGLDWARENFEDGLRFAKNSRNPNSRKAFEGIFTDRVVQILTILDKTGDHATAEHLQTEALKTLDNARIREALKAHP